MHCLVHAAAVIKPTMGKDVLGMSFSYLPPDFYDRNRDQKLHGSL